MAGDDFPLTIDEVCTIHQNTFRAIWFVNAFLHLPLIAHATSKLPLDVGELRRLVRKGASRTLLSLWILVYGILGTSLCFYKAATLWLFNDHTKIFPVLAHAIFIGILFGPVSWSFFFALVAPFLGTAPDSKSLVARVKNSFLLLSLICSTLVVTVGMVQALRVEGKERVMLSIVYLSTWAFDIILAMLALGIVCRKVYTFSFVFVPFHTIITDCCGILYMSFEGSSGPAYNHYICRIIRTAGFTKERVDRPG
jgi:hypothetical protein